ncbi:alpha/beta fold hydrolase [Chloroflexus aggregans]|uniref:Alpha/beta hydrolase fold protein n=1 Tax=Chloroflexus aggregans (strain MD-66 / DSM 9485) TaxID=326427 RepID=B8G5B1_CHLAD|nr:alpha/beta hydrolase [Chloroflexus aggregans]ACL25617.1 alpha/beta hydrolase fold protein [Chloroflexus aggregans DSM 9485]
MQTTATAAIDERFVTVDGFRLRVLTAGQGPVVLLLHGFVVSADDWMPTIQTLATAGYCAIAPDALGFGKSDKPGGAVYTLRRYADLNAGVLTAFGVEHAAVIGHSMGGKHALATTILHPHRVERLVIVDSEGFMRLPLFMRKGGSLPFLGEAIATLSSFPFVVNMQLRAAFAQPDRYITPELVVRGQKTLSDPAIRNTMISLSRFYDANDLHGSGLWPRLAEIRQPTLIIWGKEDRLFPVKCAYEAKRALPHARLEIIPNCGHFPMIEATDHFHQLVLAFLPEK